MAVNYVDYEVLNTGKTVYANQANAIMDIIDAINRMNSDLQQGWSNETARAFVERISSDHIPKLRKASEAIQEVSDYINTYLANRQSEDSQGASAISG